MRTCSSGALLTGARRPFFEWRVSAGAGASSSLSPGDGGRDAKDGIGGNTWFGAAVAVVGLIANGFDESIWLVAAWASSAGGAAHAVPHASAAMEMMIRNMAKAPPVTRSA